MAGLRAWVTIYFKGVAMGSADAVPGVSGGTIALIVGVYERLVAAITAATPSRARRILAGLRPGGRDDAVTAVRELDAGFLLALGAGIATAVVTVLSGVDYLLTTRPVATYGFFFGLIAASAGVLLADVDLATPTRKAAAVGGFALAFLASGFASAAVASSLPVVAVAGAVAVSAMILPGISGSLLLIVLGQYDYMAGTVGRFVDGAVAFVLGRGATEIAETAPVVVAFCAGGVVGLVTIAHAVRYALARARAATMAFLVSLVVGALRAPVGETTAILAESGESWGAAAPRFGLAALGGAALVWLLSRYSSAIQY